MISMQNVKITNNSRSIKFQNTQYLGLLLARTNNLWYKIQLTEIGRNLFTLFINQQFQVNRSEGAELWKLTLLLWEKPVKSGDVPL